MGIEKKSSSSSGYWIKSDLWWPWGFWIHYLCKLFYTRTPIYFNKLVEVTYKIMEIHGCRILQWKWPWCDRHDDSVGDEKVGTLLTQKPRKKPITFITNTIQFKKTCNFPNELISSVDLSCAQVNCAAMCFQIKFLFV